MGHRIIFATGNEGKMREIRLILADLGLPIETVVLVNVHNIPDIRLTVLSVGFLPADERGYEQRVVFCRKDGLGR